MPNPFKKKKEEEQQVRRYTDTGTGAAAKTTPKITNPGAAGKLNNQQTGKPKTTTTPKVEKPGMKKTGTISQSTDTGTGGEKIKQRKLGQELVAVDRKGKEVESRVKDNAESIRLTQEKLSRKNREETLDRYTSRKERENNQQTQSTKGRSRSTGLTKTEDEPHSMTGKEYLEYVLEAKKHQQDQDVASLQAIQDYKRNRYLVGLNIQETQKELEATKTRQQELMAALDPVAVSDQRKAARGDAAMLKQIEEIRKSNEAELNELAQKNLRLTEDIAAAKTAQFYEKGYKSLDNIKTYSPGAWDLIDKLAQNIRQDAAGSAEDASGTFDVNPEYYASMTQGQDEIRARLRKMGYKEEDIDKLVDYRARQINEVRMNEAVARAQEFAKAHPFTASAASVAANIAGGFGILDAAAQKLRNPDAPIDYNSGNMLASNWTDAVRGTVSQKIVDNAQAHGRSGAVGNFLYQTGMSMADSAVNMALAAVGIPEQLGLTILGGSAATASMREAHKRGLSDTQALSLGLISGIAEYATERIGLDAFMETLTMKGANRGTIVRSLMSNMLAEGGEEVLSDVVNFVADQIIAGDQSEFRKNIETYKTHGLSDSEALASAVKDQLGDTALSFLGGALSGGVMGAGGHIISGISNEQHNQMLVGAMSLEDNNPVKIAAVAVRNANREISRAMQERGASAPNEEETRRIQQVYAGFETALQQADPEIRKLVEKQGKATVKAQKQLEREARREARAAERQANQTPPQLQDQTAQDREARSERSAEAITYSANPTVQQAAELVATGNDRKISRAVSAVFRSKEAQSALGLSFDASTSNDVVRTEINKALTALVAESQRQAQETGETAAVSAQSEDEAAFQRFSKLYDRVNGEGATEAEKRAAFQEYGDSFVADGQLWTRAMFAEEYRKRMPDATDQEIETRFQQVKALSDESLARREKTEYTGAEGQAAKEENHGKEEAETSPGQSEAAGAGSTAGAAEADSTAAAGTGSLPGSHDGLDGRSDVGQPGGREKDRQGKRGNVAEAAERGAGHRGDVSGRTGENDAGKQETRQHVRSREKGKRPANRPGNDRGSASDAGAGQRGLGRENGNSPAAGRGKSGDKRRLNYEEANRVRGLNLKTQEVMIPGARAPMQVIDDAEVPEEYRGFFDEANRIGLKLKFILGYFKPKTGKGKPAFIDLSTETVYVSLDNEYQTARTLFEHETGHHLIAVTPKLWGDLLQALEDKGYDYALLRGFVESHYKNYEKDFGELTDNNADYFIEEMLCDIKANRKKDGFPNCFARMRKAVMPLFEQAAKDAQQNTAGMPQSRTGGIRYFDMDNMIPPWELEEGYEEDTEDPYDDVMPEDKRPDVEEGSLEETGDAEENDNYYADSGGETDTPSGLAPEEVVYDPEQLAYYDKASGRLVVFDEASQTFFYDEFREVFGDEAPGAMPENEQERMVDQNGPAPGYVEGETAVGDMQPTATNTENFKSWFNDPTEGRELSAARRGKKPKTLFHGSTAAGFTSFLNSMGGSTQTGGIYLTDDVHTANLYARNDSDRRGPREFRPAIAKSWAEAEHFARKDLGMRLEQDDNGYTLYMYNEKTKLYDEKATFSPDEAGLQSFNETYGEAHKGVQTPGVYRLYGTAENALVIDAHGRNWQAVLYDPVGRDIAQGEPRTGHWWSTDELVDRAFASGYDCVIFKNVLEGIGFLTNDYVFRDPGQVKSVYNTGSWDRSNPDLRYFDEDEGGWDLSVSYDAKAETVTLEGKTYRVAEFINLIPDLWDDYSEDEMYEIQAKLADAGFQAGTAFSQKNRSPVLKKDTPQYDEILEYVEHGSRPKVKAKPGFSEDYGVGDQRGLYFDQVIYDEDYDNDDNPTPFFEKSTGKPVYFSTSFGAFLYDEVREVLGAENPELLKVLEAREHFPDFDKDLYDKDSPMLARNETVPRRALSKEEKDDVQREVKRKRGTGSYSGNLYAWFNDPTETKELTGVGGYPLVLYHGSYLSGYTRNKPEKLRRRGFFTTQLANVAAHYSAGQDIEFVPRHLNGWDEAEVFINEELGMHLEKDGQQYQLWSVNPETGELEPMRAYDATEAGLQELNDTYGDLYSEAAMKYRSAHPGTYRMYGTSDKAFVFDLGDGSENSGGNWMEVLFNPSGLVANPKSKNGEVGFWDTDDLADFLFSQGYDCVIVKHVRDGGSYDNNDYIFRDPGQLKSIYNVGTFDRRNPDIRYFDEDDNEIEPPVYTFDEQVDLTLAGALDNHVMALVGGQGNRKQTAVYVSYETPNVLQSANLKGLPLLITQRHLRASNTTRKENASGRPLSGYEHYHGISAAKLKKLPELLAKPAMIMDATGTRTGDIIVVTTEKDYKGRQIVVPIHPAGTAIYDGVEGPANFITSVYGYGNQASDIRGLIELAARQGRVIYAQKQRSQAIMARTGGNARRTAFDQLSFDQIIHKIPDPVNPERLQRRFFDEDESAGARQPDTFEALLAAAEAAYGDAAAQAKAHPVTASSMGSTAQRDEVMTAWIIARRRFGAIPQTGTNFREVQVPAQMEEGTKVSKTVSTVMGAEATPEDRLQEIAAAVVGGKLSHVPVTDKIAENRVRAKISSMGFQEARIEWTKAISEGKVNKNLVAMGATLLNNAGNSEASGREYIGILTDYTDLLRRAGQALQAAKLLKTLSPEAQLYAAQRQVDRLNEDLTKRGFDPTQHPGVKIDQALVDAYRRAKTDAERAEIMEQIAQNIADQIPSSFMDKFTAWRYLAMLGNFRTQVRNVLGNTMMQPMRMLKADVAGLAEALVQRVGGRINRTTSVLRDGETFKAAYDEFATVRELILGGGKFDDSKRFAREIEEKRRIFKFKPLEAYRKATNWAMDQGDAIFCSFTYADALARYIKANGTTWSKASEELKDKAREFAIREAAEATYRDDNAFSNLIVRARIRNPDNAVKKAAAAVVEGVLPFRKTPANILVRTVEYSPVGLVHGAYSAAAKAVGKGNVTGAEIVNQLAKGLTGSGLLYLGLALAAKGLLVGKAPDDDKEKEAWKREGHQAYALEINGTSYTLDWMAPTCVPLFLGANLHEALLAEGLTLDTALEAMKTISDPVLEMSMLQGIQNLIDNAANYGDDSALVRLTTDALWSYVSQVVPTMLGQGERAFENTRMQTYTDKNSSVPTDVQYAVGKMSAKIPQWDYAQIVYTDAWGRTQTDTEDATLHALAQFFSPGYLSKIETTPMELELNRLYKATGDKGVLIASADRKIEYTWEDVNGKKHSEKKNLTGDEYLTYNTARGQLAYQLMTELTGRSFYANKSDDVKADLVEKVYEYATARGKKQVVSQFELPSWVQKAQTAGADIGLSEIEFIDAYVTYGSSYFTDSAYEKLKQAVDIGVSVGDYVALKRSVDADQSGGVTQAEAQAYLDSTNFTRGQKAQLWNIINKSWKKNPYA